MRSNIVLGNELADRARKLCGIRTKREVIHEALGTLIQIQEQSRIKSLRGKLHLGKNINELRENRSDDHRRHDCLDWLFQWFNKYSDRLS